MEEPIFCGLKSACRERVSKIETKSGKKKKSLSKKKMFPYSGRVK